MSGRSCGPRRGAGAPPSAVSRSSARASLEGDVVVGLGVLLELVDDGLLGGWRWGVGFGAECGDRLVGLVGGEVGCRGDRAAGEAVQAGGPFLLGCDCFFGAGG